MDRFNKNNFDNIKFNENMSKYTTFKIGGPADIFIDIKSIENLTLALKIIDENNLDYYILGNGSNTLVSDKGYRGVILRLKDKFKKISRKGNLVSVSSGVLNRELSNYLIEQGLGGFEFASGIPGTIGGAIRMNAGAYGFEMKDIVKSVKVMDRKGNIKNLSNKDMLFSYRNSIIGDENLVVLEAELIFKEDKRATIDSNVRLLDKKREDKQPLEMANGGSTFKRPEGFYAGKLIEDAGLRGLKFRSAQVSSKHSGFIINLGDSSCEEVLTLINLVQKIVFDNFKVELEREIRLIGEE